ncbi:single-stranded DNA-binding protein [Lentilactobacillus sp. SPB1-3]|uniref:Single-stranded DNA-binding protein n=1 Tax=Lentilactobacillus terminaliae TaxID=3003483 RepID=A0ACD5DD90_9LACO|nr:single-stranded DNA-binding protein [Lentilactobacillus sp. SPB1-3]MCZ0978058.1 single-stranded DNA-binding protein [Lentilactobacillus sp. SPB1-3]
MRQITISGNLGSDPLLNTTSGTPVANFSVAVRKNRPDKGTNNYGTDWFRCSVWGKRANTIEQFYKKGSHVTVTGTFELTEYEGKPQLNINVNDFDLPDAKPVVNQADDELEISDDELPF